MPLSEQEQRLLDEMERHLMRGDADVVSAPSKERALSYRHAVYGALLVIVGLIGLVVGVALSSSTGAFGLVVGVVGFALMLGGAILAFTPVKRASFGPVSGGSASGRPAAPSQSFMDRMNDRWDKRQNEH